jgi:hypothetical protein
MGELGVKYCEAETLSGWNPVKRSFSGGTDCPLRAKTERDGKQLCARHARVVDNLRVRRATLNALVESKWPRFKFPTHDGAKEVFKDPDLKDALVDLLFPHFRMAKQ